MAVNTDIATISQNPALNGPLGSDPVSSGDDAIRYALSFTAKLRDGVGFSAGAIVAALGYTPVIRGGIAGTDTNPVNIGFNTSLGRMTVASSGNNFSNRWPIDVDGPARSLRSAGVGQELQFRWEDPGGAPVYVWCGNINEGFVRPMNTLAVASAANATNATNATTAASCSGNSATATTAANANALGGFAASSYAKYINGQILEVEGPRDNGVIGRAIPNLDARVNYFNVSGPDLIVEIDGVTYAIQKSTPSDERLKENINPTEVDSVQHIAALDFKKFDFNGVVELMAGQKRELGVIAQQAQAINPAWVKSGSGYLQLDPEAMLMSAMHAIQQLIARVAELEADDGVDEVR